MDTDITQATNAFALDKIKTQDKRDLFEAVLLPAEWRRQVVLALIPKYMTTGTATTDAAILLDAQNDAKRLKAALDEIMKVQP